MTQRRRVFHLVAGAFAVTDLLRRTWGMINDGARPIDWLVVIVDFLVLIVILWFEGGERRHKRNMRKRIASLSPFMERGQALQRAIPNPLDDSTPDAKAEKVKQWIDSVSDWDRETRDFLEQCSPRAAAAFGLIAETSQLANPQYVYTESGSSFPISGDLQRESYQRLVAHLKNLRSITEKPEAYFG